MIGSLNGSKWIPERFVCSISVNNDGRWYNNLENGFRGRDFAIDLAKKMVSLDLFEPLNKNQNEINPKEWIFKIPIIFVNLYFGLDKFI